MKLCLLVHTGYGVVVYEAGTDPAKALALLREAEERHAPSPCSIAVLHPKPTSGS